MTLARNTAPMLLLKKPGTGVKGVPPRLRTDMEGILRRVARKPYRSMADGKDAYEQIRVDPAHVERTAMTTPIAHEPSVWPLYIAVDGCVSGRYRDLLRYSALRSFIFFVAR